MTRAELHYLIDELPDAELQEAGHYLTTLRSVEYDDEEMTEAEKEAIAESLEQLKNGEVFTLDEVIAELDPDFKF